MKGNIMKILTKTGALSVAVLAIMTSVSVSHFAVADSHGKGKDRVSFAERDLDGNGTLSLDEFLQANGKSRMARLDANSDGVITSAEIDEGASKRGDKYKTRLLERVDTNGDGQLDKAELENARKEQFSKLDANSDGQLTEDEMKSGRKGDRKKKKSNN